MKKIAKSEQPRGSGSKLKLSRETLRRLEASELEHVVGATVITCAGITCQASLNYCAEE